MKYLGSYFKTKKEVENRLPFIFIFLTIRQVFRYRQRRIGRSCL